MRDDDIKQRFDETVAEHQMDVLLEGAWGVPSALPGDYGPLYRHLRFQRPGTVLYSFDLITWPGYLTICGDCGTYVFARAADMFGFFEGSSGRGHMRSDHTPPLVINPHYWAEKLQAPQGRSSVLVYSQAIYDARVRQWLHDHRTELGTSGIRHAERELLGDHNAPSSGDQARYMLDAFEWNDLRIDHDGWDLRDYDFQFLWCCYAIVWGIVQYRRAKVVA